MLESALSLLRNDSKLEPMTLVDIVTTLQLVADQFVDMDTGSFATGPPHVAIKARPDATSRPSPISSRTLSGSAGGDPSQYLDVAENPSRIPGFHAAIFQPPFSRQAGKSHAPPLANGFRPSLIEVNSMPCSRYHPAATLACFVQKLIQKLMQTLAFQSRCKKELHGEA